jgi:hypothetical protein
MNITDFRCCLCPNINTPRKKLCPPGGPGNEPETICRFTKIFHDNEDNKVFVSHGINTNKKKWISIKQDIEQNIFHINEKELPVRNTYDEAQHDLNAYAINKGWTIYE